MQHGATLIITADIGVRDHVAVTYAKEKILMSSFVTITCRQVSLFLKMHIPFCVHPKMVVNYQIRLLLLVACRLNLLSDV